MPQSTYVNPDLTEQEHSIVMEGMIAHCNGLQLENNPYIESPLRHYWTHGWLCEAEHTEHLLPLNI